MKQILKRLFSFAMAVLMVLSLVPFNGLEVYAAETNEIRVNSAYNSGTEGFGTTKFANYASAYAYATVNNKKATIIIEDNSSLSGFTFDNNHKNYTGLAVVIEDGAVMGDALSKWDMTYKVTVLPGGKLEMARPKSASVSNMHIKAALVIGQAGSEEKAYANFLSDTYQDGDMSIRYNGSVTLNNAEMTVQDLDAQGKLTATDSTITVDGAFASATFYATTLTNSTMTVGGEQISGGLSDFAGGSTNQLGNTKLKDSTITFNSGVVTVAATVNMEGASSVSGKEMVVKSGKQIKMDATSALTFERIENNGTINGTIVVPAGTTTTLSGTGTYGAVNVAEGASLEITGGKFSQDVSAYCPAGYKAVDNGDGTYSVVFDPAYGKVAQIGDTYYETLAAAIAAATDGDTITFVADINEDVTLSKNLIIDGADKTYTGKMTLKADTTIKNVNFDGKGYNGYAVETRGANYVTIEDCTAKNYGYGFVQLASATVSTTVKNVTVSDMNYGVKVDYSNAVVLENVEITASVAAVLNSNYGSKTITIKNSDINILGTWTRNNTIKTAYVFEGENVIDSFIIDAAIDTFKLAADATLTAPNDITVTTDVDGKMVVYDNGVYQLDVKYEGGTWGGIDWKLYEDGTLIIAPTAGTPVPDANSGKTYDVGEWREAVRYDSKGNGQAIEGWPYDRAKVKKLIIEEGVTSIGSFTAQGFTNLTGEVVIPSTVTYIGQEAFQKSTMTKLTFAAGGTEELCIAQGAFKNLVIEEVALPADRPVHLHAWVFNNCHNLKHVYLPASLVSVHGTNHIDYFKDFQAHSNPTWTRSSEIFAYDENLETVTFGSEAVRDMFFANNNGTSKDYLIAYNGLVAYCDLQAAVDAAHNGDTVKLIKNVTLTETVTVPADKTVTLDLNGKTITGKPAEAKAFSVITNKGNLTITGDGSVVCDHQLAGSTGYAVNTITNGGTLIVDGATIENKSTASNQIGYAIDNNSGNGNAVVVIKSGEVKASGSNYYDGIRQFCNSLTNENSVTVNGGTVSSIWLQNPSDGTVEKDQKDVKGSVSITGGTVNALYLEPSAAFDAEITGGYVGKVEYFTTSEGRDLIQFITGGTFGMDVTAYCALGYQAVANTDGTYTVERNESIVAWNMQTGAQYETVMGALLAAKENETVQLIKDSNEANAVLTVLNGITLDLNGHTLTAYYAMTATVGSYIIDSTEGQGLLKVAKNNLVLADNTQLKIWKEEENGYCFAAVSFKTNLASSEAGKATFMFYLNEADGAVMEELADGAADNDGLYVQVRMTYTNSQGGRSVLYFDFPADKVVEYAEKEYSGRASYLFMTIAGLDTVTNVSFEAVVGSGSIMLASAAVPYNG